MRRLVVNMGAVEERYEDVDVEQGDHGSGLITEPVHILTRNGSLAPASGKQWYSVPICATPVAWL
jgi:hypothetical protein